MTDPIIKDFYVKNPDARLLQYIDSKLRTWQQSNDFNKVDEILKDCNVNRIDTKTIILIAKSTILFKASLSNRQNFIIKAKKVLVRREQEDLLNMLQE